MLHFNDKAVNNSVLPNRCTAECISNHTGLLQLRRQAFIKCPDLAEVNGNHLLAGHHQWRDC